MVSKAFVIVGLGNPGKEYEQTRHNIGFLIVQALADKLKIAFSRQTKFEAKVAQGMVHDVKVHLLLPETYMNESGRSVGKLLDFYKLTANELLVVVDDMALPFGHLRVRLKGSAGGHNGLKSIQEVLGTDEYLRLRVGIGKDVRVPSYDHVLGRFTSEEKKGLCDVLAQSVACLQRLITEDFHKVANDVNRRLVPAEENKECKK